MYFVVNSFDTGAQKQNDRRPTSGGGHLFTVETFLFTPALAGITSSEN
jgi:hypothetical protein